MQRTFQFDQSKGNGSYTCNCYAAPARLFTFGESEILSKEGRIQGNPISMGAYALGIVTMLHFLLDFVLTNKFQTKEIAFADDLIVVGKLADIKHF